MRHMLDVVHPESGENIRTETDLGEAEPSTRVAGDMPGTFVAFDHVDAAHQADRDLKMRAEKRNQEGSIHRSFTRVTVAP